MSALSRTVRILVAAMVSIAFYLFWVYPAWLAPTFAVAAFVLVSFLLGCASPWFTLVFASLMAITSALLFAAGLSFHTSIAESVSLSFEGFGSLPQLLLWFVVFPFMTGAVLHFLVLSFTRRSPSSPKRGRVA
jgi:hypothetical protein